MTENALKTDGRVAEPGAGHGVCLRLQSFGRDGLPRASYAYPLDMPESEAKRKTVCFRGGRDLAAGRRTLVGDGTGIQCPEEAVESPYRYEDL